MSGDAAAAHRMRILERLGARDESLDELVAFTNNPYAVWSEDPPSLPLVDEVQTEAWSDYEAEARNEKSGAGAAVVLRRRLVQLAFPIRSGMSQAPEYRASVVRSVPPPPGAGVEFDDPAGIELRLHPSPAGRVPVIVARRRSDFESLVRALMGRSEPIDVPPEMGACLVRGLINQDRVRRYRNAWAAARGGDDERAWAGEMKNLAPRKELYQDRLILLSQGNYSAVDASEIGLDEEAWLSESLRLRRDHECFHYLTSRLSGIVRSHPLDEVCADLAGMLATRLGYRADQALRFLGLDRWPEERRDARINLYLENATLSPSSRRLLLDLVVRSVGTLAEALIAEPLLCEPSHRASLLLAVASCGLVELGDSNRELAVEGLVERWRSSGASAEGP
ncbi:MAG: hypothetical protein K8J08_22890 [Thermoanaerobaculia bacterium]|nr:hypothetical protein [Thermoanaerobaculia bacterium]